MRPYRYKVDFCLKNWASFTDIYFSKTSFQAYCFWFFPEGFLCISHPIFLGESFFPVSLMRCARGSCSLLLSDEYIQALCMRLNIQGPERCDDSEQGSLAQLVLMRAYCWWFHICSYLPQLFCRCLSSPALIFTWIAGKHDSLAEVHSFPRTCVIATQ